MTLTFNIWDYDDTCVWVCGHLKDNNYKNLHLQSQWFYSSKTNTYDYCAYYEECLMVPHVSTKMSLQKRGEKVHKVESCPITYVWKMLCLANVSKILLLFSSSSNIHFDGVLSKTHLISPLKQQNRTSKATILATNKFKQQSNVKSKSTFKIKTRV